MTGDRYIGSIPPMTAARLAELRIKHVSGDGVEMLNEIQRLRTALAEQASVEIGQRKGRPTAEHHGEGEG